MLSCEPERAENERRVVEWLRRLFLESDHRMPYRRGGRIEFRLRAIEEVRSQHRDVDMTRR
jgi:hypothetical protein